ncbi:MAG: flagellar hook-associated protein FlgK [Oscillospiraceae bacterium]|nr:flagellar hook-associated protein FlgK [Oscillospiraceae bacterium]
MVRGTFFGLEIGKTGLTTAQFGLDVTGHNISNLDTEGYTRQRIVQTAYDPFSNVGRFAPVGQGLVGGGTRVMILDQIRSAYLDRRFRDETNTHAYWETRTQSLTYIQSFFDNVNEKTSINYSIAEFFRSMTEIARDPVAGAPRTLMQTTAMDFVQQLNMIYEGLIDFQKVENRAVETKIGDINRMTKDMAELNVAIYTFELTGMIANDLRDKRNLLIDQLSRYVDIEYEEYPDPFGHSMFKVSVAGQTVVDHDYPKTDILGYAKVENPLGPNEDDVSVPYWLFRVDTTFDPANPDPTQLDAARLDMSRISGGELRAHIDMRDGLGGGVDNKNRGIPYYIDMVNNLARAMLVEINKQHIQGWTDNPTGSDTSIHFFSIVVGKDANGDDIVENVGHITYEFDNGTFADSPPAAVDPKDPAIVSKVYVVDPAALSLVTARNLTLSEDIRSSAYNIAASSVEIGRPQSATGTSGDPTELQRGNNINMLRMYDLFRETGITIDVIDPRNPPNTVTRDIGSFDEYGTTIRFDVGKTLNSAKQSGETSRILTLAANNQRTAIAGVSLDEEMVSLVKFNHAYNGAARVITQMDDALDRLINGTGRVGL